MAELRAYHPTLRDKIALAFLGDRKASSPGGRIVEALLGSTGLGVRGSSLSDFTPAGPVFSADEAVRSAGEGDYKGAALNAAGAIPFGGLGAMARYGRRAAKPLENLASRSAFLYDPPVMKPRAFGEDYPGGGVSDASGKLAFDIEGRPLVARHVVGRRVVGGDDQPLSPPQLAEVATAATGRIPEAVAGGSRDLGGDVGRYVVTRDRRSGDVIDRNIFLDRSLSSEKAGKVLSHELSHAIDEIAGQIPVSGLNDQFRRVYNDLNNPQSYGKKFGPENSKYKGPQVDRELTAEAIRAYMANPNYLKTVAPKTAARIREFVNSNPKLMHTIQFNTLLGGVVGGAAVGVDRAEASEGRSKIVDALMRQNR